MLFSSIVFLFFFLPAVIAIHAWLPKRNFTRLVASLFFYAWGELGYVALLVLSIALNFATGLALDAAPHTRRKQWVLGLGIAANLLILGWFKYVNFGIEILNSISQVVGGGTIDVVAVRLPLGISFFTFQAVSYLVDVYRGDTRAERSPINLALYISMFPQLIAGPIVRYKTIAEEIQVRDVDLSRFRRGCELFILGLAQKVLIANQLAIPADRIFGLDPGEMGMGVAWLGIVSYTLQIFFDFAGYSNMALGLGHTMGFTFPKNFNYPYVARSVTDFWRRWHMSLSSWFRDYLYIPLGGNRGARLRTLANLFIVFVLCGLWHGASWSFIVWGMWHGAGLVAERVGASALLNRAGAAFSHGYVLLFVMVGWVFFRAEDLPHAVQYIWIMAGGGEVVGSSSAILTYLDNSTVIALAAGIFFSTPMAAGVAARMEPMGLLGTAGGSSPEYAGERPLQSTLRACLARSATAAYCGSLLFLCAASLASGTYNPFIYFRF